MTFEEYYSPNKWMPFGAALGFHLFFLMWDPTIMKGAAFNIPAQLINIKVMDHLPVMAPARPVIKPAAKHHVNKKAKRSGLSMHAKAHPTPVSREHQAPKVKAVPRPFISKITIPKFVPTGTDEPIAASPLPGLAPAAARRMTKAAAPGPKLSGKTRGVRASDVHFELSDRGALSASGGAVIAIPMGEERGDQAVLPSAPVIHEAPTGPKAVAGYRYKPGQGSGSGELAGRDKGGSMGYHGVVKADAYVEGSLAGASGGTRGGKVVSGKGFEIGGPVGDRKITQRRLPEYPAWAEEKGISALVKIYFTVKPDGSLRSNIRILTSSGYVELDDLAKQALLQWRFSPTSADSTADSSWGIITFRFTLS